MTPADVRVALRAFGDDLAQRLDSLASFTQDMSQRLSVLERSATRKKRSKQASRRKLLETIRQVGNDLEPTLLYLPSGEAFKMVKFGRKQCMPQFIHIPRSSSGYMFNRDAPQPHWKVPIPLVVDNYSVAWRNMADWIRDDAEAKSWGGGGIS